jgi:hypothetical protein
VVVPIPLAQLCESHLRTFLPVEMLGYSIVESDIVRLTINLEDIKPYANGSRVTLRFGNITSATINDLRGTLDWGKMDKNRLPVIEEAKSKDLTFNKSLRAGSWTHIQVVLDGTAPSELGFVRIRDLSHKSIALLDSNL